MEYERIENVKKSIISPTKLRMKLMGPHNNKKKEGSNTNSSRTSPSRLQVSDDSEFSKNCLLASKPDSDDDNDVAASTTDIGVAKLPNEMVLDLPESDTHRCEGVMREKEQPRQHQFRKGEMRPQDQDENLDYDSNASSSSFEFHGVVRGERSNNLNHVSRAYPCRQIPSKWNDAEKWIMSRQNMVMRKNNAQGNRMPVRVVPDNAAYEHTKSRMDPSQMVVFEKFPSFVPPVPHPILPQGYGGNSLIDQSTQSNDLVDTTKDSSHNGSTGDPTIRSVCMRDMGTDMTPIPSQEPSRSVTPVDATTPLRSPTSSLPSTPRGGQQEETSLPQRRELTEEEMRAKTRKEIVALGVQLGKMNIAAWASKEEEEENNNNVAKEETERIEFDKRASAWEEAEKSKHYARYKREEIRIQAWESREKAKLEAEMRRIEAKVEQMKAEAEAKIVKKIAMAKQKSEEKRALAEARLSRDAEKAAAEVEYIRETGQVPASGYKICCGIRFNK